MPFLERGIAVLVEKPMAHSLAEADAMIAAAAASGATLAVGQTERYNPAVATMLPLVTSPRFIEVHRLGAFSERSLDIDVVFDVMIHDLDIILALVRSEVAAIEAVGVPVLTAKFDIANARLRFASGCIANVTASRISRDRVRKIRFFQPDAYLSIDYAAQEVEGWRLVRRDGQRPEIQGGQIPVQAGRAAAPRARWISCSAVRDRRPPIVDGAAGRRALALATEIAGAGWTESWARWPREADWITMFKDLNDFIRRARRRARAGAHQASRSSPDLEIAAVTDRVSKSPGGGPALLFERPTGFDIPVAVNLFGSMKRMCMALGVASARRSRVARSTSSPHRRCLAA